jgi:hypothetical protein
MIEITENEHGLYLRTISKGVKYGQFYKMHNKDEAKDLFHKLVKKYETQGVLAVMRGA